MTHSDDLSLLKSSKKNFYGQQTKDIRKRTARLRLYRFRFHVSREFEDFLPFAGNAIFSVEKPKIRYSSLPAGIKKVVVADTVRSLKRQKAFARKDGFREMFQTIVLAKTFMCLFREVRHMSKSYVFVFLKKI